MRWSRQFTPAGATPSPASCITVMPGRSITLDAVYGSPRGRRHRAIQSAAKAIAYDNALAESVIGLYKTEVIRRKGPWRTLEAVEFATFLTWVDWFNTRRLLGPLGDIPPAEFRGAVL